MTSRAALLTTLLALTSALACTSEVPAPTSTREQPAAAEAEAAPEVAVTGPKITAAESVHDFGSVKPKEAVEHVFTVRNEGAADLHIDRVQKT